VAVQPVWWQCSMSGGGTACQVAVQRVRWRYSVSGGGTACQVAVQRVWWRYRVSGVGTAHVKFLCFYSKVEHILFFSLISVLQWTPSVLLCFYETLYCYARHEHDAH